MPMTIAQRARIAGFQANLRIRGRVVYANEDKTRWLTVLVSDAPPPSQDPDEPGQAKKPIYTVITALAGSIADARSVNTFTEVGTSKIWTVIFYDETSGDQVTWRWVCEASRAPDVNPEYT